ncbi:carboxypeptidase-like regulatory domain-containing protein, partial [Odoribacter sp. OttesenSCG-928-A06]|nr:carboxypeptidase-like regulatory domain-containing protein [Odoribacter sp. OttesenSCG-928-A06]
MKNVLLLFFICFQTLGGIAQHQVNLSGVVKDLSGKPLDFATISIEHTSIGTYTDKQGAYSLAIPSGKFMFVISSLG